jgi:predicted RNA-binding protein with PIN domain
LRYLIDGHNLIPKIPGMSLRLIDDENELIERLQVFCRAENSFVDVYFDQAPPGMSGARRYGRVTAHFIRVGRTADQAIAARLRQLKKNAAHWAVVSSDGQVQAEARAAQAKRISSEEFARMLMDAARKLDVAPDQKNSGLSADEVEQWLRIFRSPKRPK